MKRLFLLCLFTVSINATNNNNLFSENSFVAIVSNKQSGIFYGNPLTRELVKRSFFSGVYIIYKDPSQVNTRTEAENSLKSIADRLNSIEPARIYISNKDVELLDYLNSINKSKVTILPNTGKLKYQRYAKQVNDLLTFGKIKYKNIYIIKDPSESSSIQANYMLEGLVASGIASNSIKTILIKDFQSLRKFFTQIQYEPQSVIINKLFTLRDIELNIKKYSDDIKRELVSVNSIHLDIGFERAAYNEAVILQDNAKDLYLDLIDNADTYIRVNVLINKDRLDGLNLHHAMVNYFYRIDGMVK